MIRARTYVCVSFTSAPNEAPHLQHNICGSTRAFGFEWTAGSLGVSKIVRADARSFQAYTHKLLFTRILS